MNEWMFTQSREPVPKSVTPTGVSFIQTVVTEHTSGPGVVLTVKHTVKECQSLLQRSLTPACSRSPV